MGLGPAFAKVIQALSRGAYDVRGFQKYGPDFRSILAADEAKRTLGTAQLENTVEGGRYQNEAHRQAALKAAIENAAQMEPDTAVVGMGQVGGPSTPETQDRTSYHAPDGLGVTDDQFGAMARGARTERKSALEGMKSTAKRQLAEDEYQRKKGLLGEKHDFTMSELAAKGITAQEVERLKQEGRVQIVGMQQGGADSRNAATIQGRHEDVAAAVVGRGENAANATASRDLGGTIFDLQRDLRAEPDPDIQNSIRARISALEVQRERRARQAPPIPGRPAVPVQDKNPPPPPKAPGAHPATPNPGSATSPPPAPPVAVKSRQEVDALPDGATFILNGRTYRKQGMTAIPVG